MLKKGLVVSLILLALYAVAGFFVLPACLHPVLEKKLTLALGRQVSVGKITLNPFTLGVRITGFSIREKGSREKFLTFDELFVNVEAKSLIKGGPVVREALLLKPEVHVTRIDRNTYSFSDLLSRKDATPPKEPRKPFRFSVGNIVVRDGAVSFTDRPAGASHEISGINLSIPFVSNIDEFLDVFVQPRFSAKVNGTLFSLSGQSKPFKDSLETSLALDLKGISLPFYMGYLPDSLNFQAPSGTLDVKTRLSYVQHRGRKPSLTATGDLSIHGLSLQERDGQPLLSLPEARLTLAPSPLMDKTVRIAAVDIRSPEVFVSRDRKGVLNLARLTSPDKAAPEPKNKDGGFTVDLDSLTVGKGAVLFTDVSKGTPVRLAWDDLSLNARGISTRPGRRGTVELSSRLNTRCFASTSSSLVLKPLACKARLDVKGFEPAWVQSYFTDVLRVVITRGSISADGALNIMKKDAGKTAVTFEGNLALADFDSLDKASAEQFVRCRKVTVDKVRLGVNPGYLEIDSIRLKNFFSRILVSPDGKVNVATVFVRKWQKGKKPVTPAKPGKPAFERIAINRLVVDDARVLFVDRSVREGYSAELSRLKGTIRGLSSRRQARSDVSLAGVLNGNAPVLIKGRINPFSDTLYLDLHAGLDSLDLSPMSPYAGKYAGYAVEKGKLSLDLTYLIDRKQLDSQNNVFIDQFTFGQAMDSPTATKLPVRFAAALLKDSKGRIDIRLPVKGRTDDPQFSVTGIIIQMIKNLLVKAATSPFLLLDAIYPGASQANTLEFAYGRTDLTDDLQAKLATLSKILADKSSLKLEIRGYADPVPDRQGLTDYLFEKKLKAQKLKSLLAKGQGGISLEDVTFTPEEFPALLKKAYAAEEFPKPRNAIGLARSLPPGEMEKLIRGHIEVRESDLRLLAEGRAQKVQEHLVFSGQVSPSRMFLVETGKLKPEPRQGVKDARVELTLK